MDGGKNPRSKTEPKERNFRYSTFGSAGFFRKSVLTEKSGKNFSHPPTPFCAPSGPPLFGLGAGDHGAIRGFSFLSWSLSGEARSQISRKFKFRGNLPSKIFELLIRSGISRSEIEFFPTEGPRRGSDRFGWEPERRRTTTKSREFLIHRIDRPSFVARKQRLFDGIHNHREMDGGENPRAKTEPKERNF